MLIRGTIALELAPTLTHAVRECEWIPAFGPASLPLLVIRQRVKPTRKEEADVYAVEEKNAPTPDSRAFFVECTTKDTPDTYETVIGPGWATCTCTAGQVTRRNDKHSCKHRDALMCLVATGEM